jgi:hypothetical protein
MKRILRYLLLGAVVSAFASCALIDQDLSSCEEDYDLDYTLELVTNMTTELETQLSMDTDVAARAALTDYLGGIFTEFAHDVDLSFYDVTGDSLRLHHEAHIMDASETSYTLYIPVRQYMHTAVANVIENESVSLKESERCHTSALVQVLGDTIPSHKTGLFTARLPMEIREGEDQEFDVDLYMANCASALVLDTLDSGVKDVRVFASGFATGFEICDSLYRFEYTPIIRTEQIPLKDSQELCFAAAHFPSRENLLSKAGVDSDDPSLGDATEDPLWTILVYSYLEDGSITECVLGVIQPLLPGKVRVIKGKLYSNGTLIPDDTTVGVSVTLDWEPGLKHDVIL